MDNFKMEWLLSNLREKIAQDASSLEEVHQIMTELANTKWEKYLDKIRQIQCMNSYCLAWILPEEQITNSSIVSGHARYCIHCQDVVLARFSYPCDACGKLYARTNNGRVETCGECNSSKIANQVDTHLHRAITLQLPATLTVRQWKVTLDHFKYSCAYCGKAQTYLEHYIPLSQGGGTTKDNCLPTCNKCNLRKKDLKPEHFKSLFPQERIAAIESYQASVRSTPPIIHLFQTYDMVKNINPTSPYFEYVGQINKVQEYQHGYDVFYGDRVNKKVWGDKLRWTRQYVYEKEGDLCLIEGKYTYDYSDDMFKAG